MTAIVKVFTLFELVEIGGQRFPRMPYLAGEVLTCEAGAAASTKPETAPLKANLALVQVESGMTVTYEVTPEGYELRPATANSPTLAGDALILFGPGWRLSVFAYGDGSELPQ